ncbi:MAG: T9SS type A sorting domain-containing protein [Bacteroidota bacterium]|nr:T9SS type A sorting domain-containing protein [Bacteroidota bacterium]
MKKSFAIFLLLNLVFSIMSAQVERPARKNSRSQSNILQVVGPGSSCSEAIPVCTDYTVSTMPNTSSIQTPACFVGTPQRDIWLSFVVTQSGQLAWQGTPQVPSTEFDWALWDITTGCPGTVVCCNYVYYGGCPNGFGMQNITNNVACGSDIFAGNANNQYCPTLNVTAGNTYALQIDNYDDNSAGFVLSFVNSTCLISCSGGAQSCGFDAQITTADSILCVGDSTILTFFPVGSSPADTVAPTFLWNTGDTSSSITVRPEASANYFCVATFLNATTCIVEDTITVQVNNNPVVAFANNAAICQGDSLLLDTGNPGSTHNWCSGETAQSITVSTAGVFCVNVTDLNGCIANDTINVSVNPLPSISVLGDTICVGDSSAISASGSATNYLWNPGTLSGATVNVVPTSTTTYTVTATDVNGCVTVDSVIVHVKTLPTVAAVGDSICAGETGTLTASGSGFSYTWNPGFLSGITVTDTPLTSTMYTVTSTGVNGCSAADSAAIIVDACVGFGSEHQLDGGGIQLYPNPFHESIQISISNDVILKNVEFMVFDINGKMVLRLADIAARSILIKRDLLEDGLYFYNFTNDGAKIASGKLLVN